MEASLAVPPAGERSAGRAATLGDFAARSIAAKLGKARAVVSGVAAPARRAVVEKPQQIIARVMHASGSQPGAGQQARQSGPVPADAAASAPGTAQAPGGGPEASSTPSTLGSTMPRAGDDRAGLAAAAILKHEAEMRRTRGLAELSYFIANETRSLTRAQQIVVMERGRGGAMQVRAVSSITRVDRASPLLLWFEAVVDALDKGHGLAKAREFEAGAFAASPRVAGLADTSRGYPLRHLVWVPFNDMDGNPVAGMLQARATPWTEADIAVSRHLAGGVAHSWLAMSKARPRWSLPSRIDPRKAAFAALVLVLAALFPVSMSALAPAEVAPRDPFIVSTGVEGVVDRVLVDPNAPVKKGQPLVQLADTVLRNKYEIASREVLLAETKYKKAAQLAFVDVRGRHDMALAKAELELRLAERDYARDLLARATVTADRDGIAFFSDKKDLIGRPVAVGEKLMEIADASKSQFNVDLGVADAIVLHDGARVKVFLDSDPLHPIVARLVRADYQARAHDNQQLAFRLVAEVAGPMSHPLRLGVRGTAQVYSDTVPLAFYLLRRPIAAARQWVGL